MATSARQEHLYKVLVIGDLGTGKTSIIKKYVHQYFSPHYRATVMVEDYGEVCVLDSGQIGVDFALKELYWDNNTTGRLQLWDIAGVERFGNMMRVYYKEAVGAFVVFDVTRMSTFEAVQMWKTDLDNKVDLPNGKPIPAVLLANKCDLSSEGFLGNVNQLDEYCRDKGFVAWFETSAKENIGIDEAARCLVAKMVENAQIIDDDQRHLEAAFDMIQEKGALTLRTYHVLLHGLPGAGKTCCKMRLTGQELTGCKPAKRREDQVWYPDDDSSCSTGVAENITIAQVPNTTSARDPIASTAIIRGVDDIPWHTLESFDEEVVGVLKKMRVAPGKKGTEKLRKEETTPPKGKPPKWKEGPQLTATPLVAKAPATASALPQAAPKTLEQMIVTAFKKAKREEIQEVLQKETLIYLIDSGGQPQFQELLPVLVSGPTIFLLTFSLLGGLGAEYMVRYTSHEGERYAYPARRRVLDVLVNSLGSIKCTCSHQTRGKEMVEVKPRVIFVGTMRDLVSEAELSAIDQELRAAIEDFMDLVITNGEKLIFPVDSFAEGDGGFADLRMAIREASCEKVTKMVGGKPLTEEVCEVTLPSTSVALELLIRSLQAKNVITLEECKKLAAQCGIKLTKELREVLWHLQYFIGTVRHYPDNPDLRDYVINNPQKLFDAPTKLLAETFAFKKVDLHRVDKKQVWTRGIFTKATLRKLWEDEELTPELLLSLLLHLNIIAPLQEKDTFFMPCALVCAPEDGTSALTLRKDSALVCFEGGHTPKGVYSSLLTYLLKPQRRSSDLEWILPTVDGSLFSNLAKLTVIAHRKFPFCVELVVHLKFIEVAVDVTAKSISPTKKLECSHAILRSISRAVKEVVKHLHYNSNATPLEDLFFPCPCREQSGPHAGSYSEEAQLGWCCGVPSDPEQVWVDKWITASGATTLPATTAVPTPHPRIPGGASRPTLRELQYMEYTDSTGERRVLRLIDRITGCWENVGIALNMETFLPQYRHDHQECQDRVRNMLTDWMGGRHQGVDSRWSVTWADLLKALRESNEHETARELEEALACRTSSTAENFAADNFEALGCCILC